MESWIPRVSYKLSEAEGPRVNFARDPKYSYSMNRPKIEFIAYIYILL